MKSEISTIWLAREKRNSREIESLLANILVSSQFGRRCRETHFKKLQQQTSIFMCFKITLLPISLCFFFLLHKGIKVKKLIFFFPFLFPCKPKKEILFSFPSYFQTLMREAFSFSFSLSFFFFSLTHFFSFLFPSYVTKQSITEC